MVAEPHLEQEAVGVDFPLSLSTITSNYAYCCLMASACLTRVSADSKVRFGSSCSFSHRAWTSGQLLYGRELVHCIGFSDQQGL